MFWLKFLKDRFFVCDYIIVVKVCQPQLHSLYNHLETTIIFYSSKEFKDLVAYTHAIGLQWISPMINMEESLMEYLAFSFYKHTSYVIYTSLDSRIACPINWNILKLILRHIAKFVCIGIFYSPSFILLLWNLDMLQWFYDLYAIPLSIYLIMWFHFLYFLCDLSYDANAILT
jgi:hypothetical protein